LGIITLDKNSAKGSKRGSEKIRAKSSEKKSGDKTEKVTGKNGRGDKNRKDLVSEKRRAFSGAGKAFSEPKIPKRILNEKSHTTREKSNPYHNSNPTTTNSQDKLHVDHFKNEKTKMVLPASLSPSPVSTYQINSLSDQNLGEKVVQKKKQKMLRKAVSVQTVKKKERPQIASDDFHVRKAPSKLVVVKDEETASREKPASRDSSSGHAIDGGSGTEYPEKIEVLPSKNQPTNKSLDKTVEHLSPIRYKQHRRTESQDSDHAASSEGNSPIVLRTLTVVTKPQPSPSDPTPMSITVTKATPPKLTSESPNVSPRSSPVWSPPSLRSIPTITTTSSSTPSSTPRIPLPASKAVPNIGIETATEAVPIDSFEEISIEFSQTENTQEKTKDPTPAPEEPPTPSTPTPPFSGSPVATKTPKFGLKPKSKINGDGNTNAQ
jgi:hypothetical protein